MSMSSIGRLDRHWNQQLKGYFYWITNLYAILSNVLFRDTHNNVWNKWVKFYKIQSLSQWNPLWCCWSWQWHRGIGIHQWQNRNNSILRNWLELKNVEKIKFKTFVLWNKHKKGEVNIFDRVSGRLLFHMERTNTRIDEIWLPRHIWNVAQWQLQRAIGDNGIACHRI